MLSSTAIEIFSILQDKYGSPNLEESEILHFLNMAQYEKFNRLLPDDMGGQVNFEFDENTSFQVKPFIYTLTGLTTTSGVLSNAVINAALVSASEANAEMFRILKISWTSNSKDYPVKYVKNNNINQYERNFFKDPSATNPRYSLTASGLRFYPTSDTLPITLTVIKRPRTLTNANSPEWDDYSMNQIILIALQLAGVSTRDEELIQDIRNIKVAN